MLTTKKGKKRFESKLLANFFFRCLRKFLNGGGTSGVQGCIHAALTVSLGFEILFEITQTYPHGPPSNSKPFTSKGDPPQGRQ